MQSKSFTEMDYHVRSLKQRWSFIASCNRSQ